MRREKQETSAFPLCGPWAAEGGFGGHAELFGVLVLCFAVIGNVFPTSVLNVQLVLPLSMLAWDASNHCSPFILPHLRPLPCHLAFPPTRGRGYCSPPTSTDLGFGQLMCFGQWNVSRHEPGQGMACARVAGLALLHLPAPREELCLDGCCPDPRRNTHSTDQNPKQTEPVRLDHSLKWSYPQSRGQLSEPSADRQTQGMNNERCFHK